MIIYFKGKKINTEIDDEWNIVVANFNNKKGKFSDAICILLNKEKNVAHRLLLDGKIESEKYPINSIKNQIRNKYWTIVPYEQAIEICGEELSNIVNIL